MIPFFSSVSQHYRNWLIISNKVLESDDSQIQNQKPSTLIYFPNEYIECSDNNSSNIEYVMPDINQPCYGEVNINVNTEMQFSHENSDSELKKDEDSEKHITMTPYSMDNSNANQIRLLKIQRQKKFVKRRNSFVFLFKLKVSIPDKFGIVDLANPVLGMEYLNKFIDSWKFNIFRFNRFVGGNSPLIHVVTKILETHNLISLFNIDSHKLLNFLYSVQNVYHSFNPYHNALHASDVMQAMHCFLLEDKLKCITTPLEVLGCLLAALCHDADHPGQNQIYLEKINHFFVSMYNHMSVLENHHYRVTMSLLHKSSLLNGCLQEDEWLKLSTLIENLILATDIAHQKSYLNRFINFIRDQRQSQELSYDDKTLVYQLAMKCSDISNPCRAWPVTLGWATLICEEFYIQGDVEKKQGLAVMSTHDRCMSTKADIQLNFIRFVVRPLITQWLIWLRRRTIAAKGGINSCKSLPNRMESHLEHNLTTWELYKQHHSFILARKLVKMTPTNTATAAVSKVSLVQVQQQQQHQHQVTEDYQSSTAQSVISGQTVTPYCLATLTEESTIPSSYVSSIRPRVAYENQFKYPITYSVERQSRRFSLPETVAASSGNYNSSAYQSGVISTAITESTTMTVLSRTPSSTLSNPYYSQNYNVSHNLLIPPNITATRRRCSLPQYVRPPITVNTKYNQPNSMVMGSGISASRRGSLPINMRTTYIPVSWDESATSQVFCSTTSNNEDWGNRHLLGSNRKGGISSKSIIRTPNNFYCSRGERRGSAPLIGCTGITSNNTTGSSQQTENVSNQVVPDICSNISTVAGSSAIFNRPDSGLISSCSGEHLLFEVYWKTAGAAAAAAVTSSASSCNSLAYHHLSPSTGPPPPSLPLIGTTLATTSDTSVIPPIIHDNRTSSGNNVINDNGGSSTVTIH